MTDTTAPTETEAPATPVVTVTSGNPTPEEIAAVTVLLAAAASGEDPGEATARRGWARPARRLGGGVAATGWGRF